MDEAIPLEGQCAAEVLATSSKRARLTLGLIVVIVFAVGIVASYWFHNQPREEKQFAAAIHDFSGNARDRLDGYNERNRAIENWRGGARWFAGLRESCGS